MKKNDTEHAKVRLQLGKALEGVNNEIEKCRKGQPALDSEVQLNFISRGLQEMADVLDKHEYVGKKRDIPGLWRIVIDTWPYTDPLRKLIVEAELGYEQLIKKKVRRT
jgi:hypothetical protein